MYKTAVYWLVNGGVTHQNSKYLKNGDIVRRYIDIQAIYCCVVSNFSDSCCF